MSVVKSIKILCLLEFPTGAVRLWDGSGPYLDSDGNIWRCCVLSNDALDTIETAINGEAWTLSLSLSGVDTTIADLAWEDTESGNVIDSKIQILIQDCDADDQPSGNADVKFTGYIDDIEWNDYTENKMRKADVLIQVRNRFTLRTQTSGAVLSDVDQQARSLVLNPTANPDKFCERTPGLAEKTIRWPAWD